MALARRAGPASGQHAQLFSLAGEHTEIEQAGFVADDLHFRSDKSDGIDDDAAGKELAQTEAEDKFARFQEGCGGKAAVVGHAKFAHDESRQPQEPDIEALEAHAIAEQVAQFQLHLITVLVGE